MTKMTAMKPASRTVTVCTILLLLVCLPVLALEPPDGGTPPGDPPPPPGITTEYGIPEPEIILMPATEVYIPEHVQTSGYVNVDEVDPETQETATVSYANDLILVRFKTEATTTEIDQAIASVGGDKVEYITWDDLYGVGITPATTVAQLQAKVSQLQAISIVESAELDRCVSACQALPLARPNDWFYNEMPFNQWQNGQWNLRRIGMQEGLPLCSKNPVTGEPVNPAAVTPGAWHKEVGKGSKTTVGVVDTGIDTTHADMAPNIIMPGSDAVPATGNPHGTRVASIIAALTNNVNAPGEWQGTWNHGLIAGIGWDTNNDGSWNSDRGIRVIAKNASDNLTPVKFQESNVQKAIQSILTWGDNNRDSLAAINIPSYGKKGTNVYDATGMALKKGVLCVAPSGNPYATQGNNSVPSTGPTIAMLVGATAHDQGDYITEFRAPFSTYGSTLSVVAPGNQVVTLDAFDPQHHGATNATGMDGTSFAAPHVSGVVALLHGEFQSMGSRDFQYRIEDTADDSVCPSQHAAATPGWDPETGWGFLRADRALASDGSGDLTIDTNKTYMLTLPVWPEESSTSWLASVYPENVLPSTTGLPSVVAFDPSGNKYFTSGSAIPNHIDPAMHNEWWVKPFRAYFVRYPASAGPTVTIHLKGAKAGIRASHGLEYRLPKGWNMIGNPFFTALPVDGQHMGFRLKADGATVSPSQAVTNNCIGNTIYRWDPADSVYVPTLVNAATPMAPFDGYFMKVLVDDLYVIAKP